MHGSWRCYGARRSASAAACECALADGWCSCPGVFVFVCRSARVSSLALFFKQVLASASACEEVRRRAAARAHVWVCIISSHVLVTQAAKAAEAGEREVDARLLRTRASQVCGEHVCVSVCVRWVSAACLVADGVLSDVRPSCGTSLRRRATRRRTSGPR